MRWTEENLRWNGRVAVPILDNKKRYFGALAVHGPSNRFDIDEAVTRLEVLVPLTENS